MQIPNSILRFRKQLQYTNNHGNKDSLTQLNDSMKIDGEMDSQVYSNLLQMNKTTRNDMDGLLCNTVLNRLIMSTLILNGYSGGNTKSVVSK